MAKTITVSAFLTTILPLVYSSGIPIVVSPGLNFSIDPNITPNLTPCTTITSTNAPTIPCFTKLQVASYLENFNSTLAEVCSPTQLFSQCLLATVTAVPGLNCTSKINTTTMNGITSASNSTTCVPFDCATLNSRACPAPTASTNMTIPQAQGYYAVYSLYSVNQFLSGWATALNRASSEPAILSVLNNTTTPTPTGVLVSLITRYGLNPNADAKLVQLAQVQSVKPDPQIQPQPGKDNAALSLWRGVLVDKLQKMSFSAAGNFTSFVGLVGDGDFSVKGLAGANQLIASLSRSHRGP
ncbi:hypothetical protein N7G274_004986 [Stereocaulon virgatum]|uniref:Secreted protein n=1 Tax=Stereocaulon virgatum TaxID=373712 RepID=A0ABR4A9V2_9LECA